MGIHPDLRDALASVEDEFFCTLDVAFVLRVVNTVYAMRCEEKGVAFRALFDKALIRCGGSVEEHRLYILAVARYFNKRAVAAKKRRKATLGKTDVFPRVRHRPTATKVSIEVFPDVLIAFYAHQKNGMLSWNDVHFGDLHPAITQGEVYSAHKMALATMNSRRKNQKAPTT
tara:strand:+ start:19093 stop:19608 length:516 start_codon:yes stop_codon:yes gene_type:complete